MKYTFPKTIYVELDVDFQQIYDYVKKDYESDGYDLKDKWTIYDYFCDNIGYFIEKIYGYKVDDEGSNYCDTIVNDFSNWLESQK